MADEVFNMVAAGLKGSVVLPRVYFIRASDARKYNANNRHLKITSANQSIPEPIRNWLLSDFRHRNDFEQVGEVVPAVAAETAQGVVFAPLPEIDEATVVEEQVSEPLVEVDLDNDTLYIAAYDANLLYAHIDGNDFEEMTLEELQAYVDHYGIDIGRATSETTIRERVTEWYLNANLG